MAMTEQPDRKRPLKLFRALSAFGNYRKGDTLQPTGMYRDVLVKRGLIVEITDTAEAVPARDAKAATNRMVPGLDLVTDGPVLSNRGRRGR
jgi:hypothetical protein